MIMKKKNSRLKSSSFYLLSADFRLPFKKKIYWFFFNFINNNLPPKFPFNTDFIKIKNFRPKLFEEDWNVLEKNVSPSRMLCDLFWKKLNWNLLKKELSEINIFDTGCGEGKYGLILNNFAKGIDSYKGVDTSQCDDWEKLSKEFPFLSYKQQKADNITDDIPLNTNVFVTQSAIEHFKYDIEYFRQLKNFIKKNKRNTVQIHIFPAPPSLWIYLLHGFRQYNFRSISKIINIFDDHDNKSYSTLFKLGGNASNLVHLKYVTYPKIIKTAGIKSFRDLNPKKYFEIAKNSILKDLRNENFKNCSFYALVIHSNYRNKIFI